MPSIGTLDNVRRASWAEAAFSMLQECKPDEEEAVVMRDPPETISEDEIDDAEETLYSMGYTRVGQNGKRYCRIREVVSEGEICRITDNYPESEVPAESGFRIFDFEDACIYEWPAEETLRINGSFSKS
jgi:hypothetical protein